MNKGFADLCLTTWLRRPREAIMKHEGGRMKLKARSAVKVELSSFILPPSS
jgi:hypothetical protein